MQGKNFALHAICGSPFFRGIEIVSIGACFCTRLNCASSGILLVQLNEENIEVVELSVLDYGSFSRLEEINSEKHSIILAIILVDRCHQFIWWGYHVLASSSFHLEDVSC